MWEHASIAPEIVDVEELTEVLADDERDERDPIRLRVDCSDDDDGSDVAFAALVLDGGALVVDECDRWIGQHPKEGWVEQVERGRHYGVSMLLATRRPARVWRTATANADTIYAFRTNEPRDVAYLRDYAGPESETMLQRLGRFEWLKYDARTGALTTGRVGAGADEEESDPEEEIDDDFDEEVDDEEEWDDEERD